MYLKKISFVPVLGLLAISACSGTAPTEPPIAGYAEQTAEYLRLAGRAASFSTTPSNDVPTSGSANYDGNIRLTAASELFVGDAAMSADFQAGTIDGGFSNFHGQNRGAIGGSLALSNGVILGANVSALVDGTLSDTDDTLDIDGSMSGVFMGPNAEMLSGVMGLNVSVNGAPDDAEIGLVLAEQ